MTDVPFSVNETGILLYMPVSLTKEPLLMCKSNPFYLHFVALVTWPKGTYGMPKAKTGCPVSVKTEWTTGWRYEDTEDNNPSNNKSRSFHLDTTVAKDINRTFCLKVKNEETTEWPAGMKITRLHEQNNQRGRVPPPGVVSW